MRRQHRLVVAVAGCFLAIGPALGQTAQDALKVVPEKAAGFVVVNNIGDLNSKVEALARRLGTPLPFSPLEKIKGELGIGAGLNSKGSVLLAVILKEGEHPEPIPLLYVPVTDYAAFLQGLNGRADGDITTVQVGKGGKQMIVGRQGSFAVFTEPNCKDALQEALRSTPGNSVASAALDARILRQDITSVLTSRGIKLAAEKARAGLAMVNNPALVPAEAQFLLGWLDGIDHFLKSVASDVSHVLLGGRVDKGGNLEVDSAALFVPGSGFAQAGAKAKSAQGESLAGLPDIPFLVAFSGSMSGNFMEEMMNVGMKFMTAVAKDVPAEKLQKLEQSGRKIVKDLRAMSMVMGTGTGKDPLFQNSYVVMKVGSAKAYLQNYEDYLAATNDLMKAVKLPEGFPQQLMKSMRTKVDGLPALEVTIDFGLGDNQIEPVKKLMEIYFGPGGKMLVTVVAADESTVLMRYTPASQAKEFVKNFKDRSSGLDANKDIAQTNKLLPKGSQWAFYISPHGAVALTHRAMTAMMPPQDGAMRLPDFPQTAPLGIGLRFSATGLEKRLVIPAAVLDSVGPFVRQIHGAKGAALSP